MSWIRALVAAGIALSGLVACASDDDTPVETVTAALARLAPPVRVTGSLAAIDEPTSYRITLNRYVTGIAGETFTQSGGQERKVLKASNFARTVTRPFDESGSVIRSLGFVREEGGGNSRVTLVRPVPDDPRPRIHLPAPDINARQRVIAGRRCVSTTVGDVEYCVDEAGLVLATRTKTSLEVATKVSVLAREPKSAAQFAAELAQGFTDTSRGSIRPIDSESAPAGTDWSLDGPPDGFELVGRYAVAPLTNEVLKRSSRRVIASIVDVYVRGKDAVIVDRGGTLDTSGVGDEDLGSLIDAHDVDLGRLGTGQAGVGGVSHFGYREVRATPAQGRFVVVAGTVPEDELLTVARNLRSWPGTTIQYLDKP